MEGFSGRFGLLKDLGQVSCPWNYLSGIQQASLNGDNSATKDNFPGRLSLVTPVPETPTGVAMLHSQVSVCVCVFTRVCEFVHTCMSLSVCLHVCVHVYESKCVCVCILCC